MKGQTVMNEKVNKWIEEHIDEYTKDLIDFCSINSVKGAYAEGKPYGDGSFDGFIIHCGTYYNLYLG